MVLIFDVGGTSTKIAVFDQQKTIIKKDLISYQNLIEASILKKLVKEKIEQLQKEYNLKAICFSTCGVIGDDGTISGNYAVINYSSINWKRDLKEYQLPIYVENDANCSLLAESEYGVGQNCTNLVSLVLGTGIGGAVILNHQILKGSSGEFGCFLETMIDGKYVNFSETASPRNIELKLNNFSHQQKSLKEYFQDYDFNPNVKRIIDEMIFVIAKNIINLSFAINPEIFIIGGAISANSWFIEKLKHKTDELMKASGMEKTWKVLAAQFKNDANILGAYSLYEKNNRLSQKIKSFAD